MTTKRKGGQGGQVTEKPRYSPPLERLSHSKQRNAVRGAERPHSHVHVAIADAEQASAVIERITAGKSIGVACREVRVQQVAFVRRIRQDRQLAEDFAAAIALKALDKAEGVLDAGQVTALSPFVKHASAVAGAFDRPTFGSSNQERLPPQLVINTNLDFSLIAGVKMADPAVIDIDALDFDQTVREAADAMDELAKPAAADDEEAEF